MDVPIQKKIEKLEGIYRSLNKITEDIEDTEVKNQFILCLENLAIGTCRFKRINKLNTNKNQLELPVLSEVKEKNTFSFAGNFPLISFL